MIRLEIVKIEEIIENDYIYIVTTYDNGYVVQELKSETIEEEKKEPILSETDEAIFNTNMNVEYLVILQELGM